MSEQFDIFEEIADQGAFGLNDGERASCNTGKGRWIRLSPAMERAKVARPAPDSPPAAASPPETIPEVAPPPAVPRVITNRDELLDLIRSRRNQLGITHETIDHLAGWASGLTSKLVADPPIRGLGPQSLGLVLEVLALGIARVEFVEDPEIVRRMSGRWVPRKRPRFANTRGCVARARAQAKLLEANEDSSNVETHDLSSDRGGSGSDPGLGGGGASQGEPDGGNPG